MDKIKQILAEEIEKIRPTEKERGFPIKAAVIILAVIIIIAGIYYAVAVLKIGRDDCLKKYPDASKENCSDVAAFENAKSQLNAEYCGSIRDSQIKEECSKTISDIILQKKVQQSTNDVGAYINAITGKNPELCGSIVDESLKSRCLNESK